ncbi:hypothetical protein [Sorangium sp. So ce1335]|uniref:hypothetical protein n=1 Tax=Sorangium sp. So ce1335 TaxID=3133335 RepID=UPI003F64856D
MEMTRLRTRLAAALAALAWGSACGGNVVVDGMPDGSGGAGATSTTSVSVGVTSTSGSWTTSAAVTSSSTGVGGGDARSMCARYCELLEGRCGVVRDGCRNACDLWFLEAPACNELLVPYLECAIDDVDQCSFFPTECEERLSPYSMCAIGPGCPPLACSGGGDRTCDCKSTCRGVDYAVACRPIGPRDVTCSCFIDGEEVFTCGDPPPACDLARGCCEPLFDERR